VQINWTLVTGLAAFSLAAAASWDAGSAARQHRLPWRVLAVVHLVLLAELLGGNRFGAIDAIDAALPGIDRPAVRIGLALLMALATGGVAIMIARVVRRIPLFAPAALATLAAAALFGVETLSVGAVGALLYRPVGPVMLIGWLWLGCGLTVVATAIVTVKSIRTR